MPKFPEYVRSQAQQRATVNPKSVQAPLAEIRAVGAAVSAFAQSASQVANAAHRSNERDRAEQERQEMLDRREREADARVAAQRYELELKEFHQGLLEKGGDHRKREEAFRVGTTNLISKWGEGFDGTAADVFTERSALAYERQEFAVRQGVWKERVEHRRGSLNESIALSVEQMSALPPEQRATYMNELELEIQRAENDNIIDADTATLKRMKAVDAIEAGWEAHRVDTEARVLVDRALAMVNAAPDEDPDGEFRDSPQAIIKRLGEHEDPVVGEEAIKRFRQEYSLQKQMERDNQNEAYDSGMEALQAGKTLDQVDLSGMSGAQRGAAERYAIWKADQRTRGMVGKIETDQATYRKVMDKLTGDPKAFSKMELYGERENLSEEDWRFFIGAQRELQGSGSLGVFDQAAYKGDARWMANRRLAELRDRDQVSKDVLDETIEMDLYKAFDAEQAHLRREKSNPNYLLTPEDQQRVTDRVILDRVIEVPDRTLGFIDRDVDVARVTGDDLERIMRNQDSQVRRDVANEMAASGVRYEAGSATERIFVRDFLERRGARYLDQVDEEWE